MHQKWHNAYEESLHVPLLGDGSGPRLFKYARSYTQSIIGDPAAEERGRDPSEYELYDLDADPTETNNLAHRGNKTSASRAAEDRLEAILNEQRAKKALHHQHR